MSDPRILRADLRTQAPKGPGPSNVRTFELRASDLTLFTTFEVTLVDIGDGNWRANATVGGDPSPGSKGCDGPSQREALVRLAAWAQRLAEGLALVTAPEAVVNTEIVSIYAPERR